LPVIALKAKKRDRIERIIKEEKATGITFPCLSRDIQALTALEKTILRQKDWVLKHPDEDLIKRREFERKEKKIENLFNSYMDVTTEDQLDYTIKVMEGMLEIIDKYSVPAKIDSDGNLILLDQD
jgi:hypothetical protein